MYVIYFFGDCLKSIKLLFSGYFSIKKPCNVSKQIKKIINQYII